MDLSSASDPVLPAYSDLRDAEWEVILLIPFQREREREQKGKRKRRKGEKAGEKILTTS